MGGLIEFSSCYTPCLSARDCNSTLLISSILSTFDFIAFYIDPSLAMS